MLLRTSTGIAITFSALFSSGTASADCSLATKTDSDINLVARIDALAACVGSQQARLDRLESAVLISEVPCSDLGDGWKLYAPAESRFIVGAGSRHEIGKTGGAERVKLSAAHMPRHNHSISTSRGANMHDGLGGSTSTYGIDTKYEHPNGDFGSGFGQLHGVLQFSGGDRPHENMRAEGRRGGKGWCGDAQPRGRAR